MYVRAVLVFVFSMSARVHAYVLAYHKICKNNAITLTVQQFHSAVQKSKREFIHCCVFRYRTLNLNLSYLK